MPAGYAAQRIGPKAADVYWLAPGRNSGLAVLAFYPDFLTIMAARCLSGVGQGLLFIGVQSYLLAVAPPGKKTQAAAIIVYGFQGGMISGMAVGSLLVGYMGTNGVFLLAAAIGLDLGSLCGGWPFRRSQKKSRPNLHPHPRAISFKALGKRSGTSISSTPWRRLGFLQRRF